MAGMAGMAETAGMADTAGKAAQRGQQLLADSVYEQLKRDILECTFVPGQVLVENALAEKFGVSKGPVREALKRLVGQGLLRSMPRVGYAVTGIKIGDIDDIFDLRIAIEPQAVRRAMERMAPEDMDRLELIAAGEPAARSAPEGERGPVLVQANKDFHVEIARLSGNGRLEHIIAGLVDELERVVRLLALNLDDVPDEHPDLVRLMREGDPDRAAANMVEQLTADHRMMRAAALEVMASRARSMDLF